MNLNHNGDAYILKCLNVDHMKRLYRVIQIFKGTNFRNDRRV